jgi:hypothetical protein
MMFKKSAAIIIIFLFTVLSVLPAEDAEPAILARGPIFHRGIEFLGVNAIPSQYGEYRYGDELITVYYTVEEIFLSKNWLSTDCAVPGLMQLKEGNNRIVIAYTDKKEWTAFLSFTAGADYICRFVEAYRNRQNYFLNIARDKTVFSFPALLEVD